RRLPDNPARLRKAIRRPLQQRNSNEQSSDGTSTSARDLFERQLRREVLAADDRPQAHRSALLGLHHTVFLPGRLLRRADSLASAHAGREPGDRRNLQQAVHHARGGHDLFLPYSLDPGRAGKFSDPTDDRRQGPGLPPAQPSELVHLQSRRSVYSVHRHYRRSGYRLDFLPPYNYPLSHHARRAYHGRVFLRRFFFHPYRTELHRHDSSHAPPGHDLVPPAALRLDALRDEPHHGSRNA